MTSAENFLAGVFQDDQPDQQSAPAPAAPSQGGGGGAWDAIMGAFGDGKNDANEFAAGAKGVLDAAKGGGWAISEEGGAALLAAVDQAEMELSEVALWAQDLGRAPALGNDDYAQQVAQHVLSAMDSDDESLLTTFKRFREGLNKIREAIAIAKSKYDEADQDATQRFGGFGS